LAETPQRLSPGVPWFTFLLLGAVFLVSQDWYSSQTFVGSGSNLDELVKAADEGNPIRRFAFWTLGAFAAISLYLRRDRLRINSIGSLGWLIVFFQAWAFLSLAWSEDPHLSLRRLGLFAMLWLAALAASQRFQLRHVVLWVFLSTVCYMHIGLLAEIVLGTFHPQSTTYRFAGTLPPNAQGVNCALLVIASLYLSSNERRWRGVFAVIAFEALVFLLLTKSRTSTGSVFLALALGYFLTSPVSRRGAMVLGLIGISSLCVLFGDLILPTLQGITTLGRGEVDDTTLTGRIPLWAELLPFIAERPLHGYGYDTFWTPRHLVDVAASQAWTVPNAHSGYLDLCLGLGLIGLGLFVLIMIGGIRRAVEYHNACNNSYYAVVGVVLIFVMLVSATETIVFAGTPVTFIVMLMLLMLAQPKGSIAIDRQPRRAAVRMMTDAPKDVLLRKG
jgi:exopolysaccharide production protein ExoQ